MPGKDYSTPMARTFSRTFHWQFDSPVDAVWPILADTARFNEAAGLPDHDVTETPRPDGSVEYVARGRMGPVDLEWEEIPVNWVWGRWFEHIRVFRKGPIARLSARLEFTPDGDGCRAAYTLAAEPANALGWLVLSTRFFSGTEKNFGKLAADARDYAAGRRDDPFDHPAPSLAPGAVPRLDEQVARIEDSGFGHGLAKRLADRVTGAQNVDLWRVRPLALAREWGVAARETVELCLEATRAGMLDLRWDLLCPRCRIAKATVASLDALPAGAHCDTCNIDYGRDYARNVELSFRPSPALRPLAGGEYCLFGPMSTPHIKLHVTVPPGETRDAAADLAPGAYRLRTLEPGPQADLDFDGGGFPSVEVSADSVAAGAPSRDGNVSLVNRDTRPRTFIVEARAWAADAFTADRVATYQAFRDLFSDQVLRPGDEVAVQRVALMFTDLRGSTALYEKVGDAAAYGLVREHFAFLARIVREHDGAIVKTIGDAIMAAFHDPADALRAALAAQRTVADFNRDRETGEVALKIGLHAGPCIAVTLNGRLDYFGGTVNLAARLQGQSRAGDIVLSPAVAIDPAVAPLLGNLDSVEEESPLRGFVNPVPYLRLTP